MEIKETYLGISFSLNKIHFVEISREDDNKKLEHAESTVVDFDFEEDLSKFKSNNKILTNVSSEILKYINKRDTKYSKVLLTIGTSQAFMIILPIDFSEGKQSLSTKIYWELSNYFPDNYNDFIINTYRLNKVMPSGSSDEFLIIAVLKNTIEFVKRVFRLCNIQLSIIDIDHFASENNLRNNREQDLSGEDTIIIGLKKNRFDFGIISNKKYSDYSYTKYSSEPEYNLALIRKLNSILASNRLTGSKENFKKIFLYGDEIRSETIEALKKSDSLKIEVINPFENINSSSEFLINEELRKSPYIYTPACGVVQRSMG
jgi:hypothetical protein